MASKNKFLTTIPKTLGLVKKNLWKLALASLTDFLFLALFGYAFIYVSINLIQHLTAIFQMINPTDMASALMQAGNVDYAGLTRILAQKEGFIAHYEAVKRLAVFLLVSTYFLWAISQSVVWWLASKTAGIKINFARFVTKFSALSLLWYAVFCLISYGYVSLSVYASMSINPLISTGTLNILAIIVYIIWLYFAFLSFAMAPKHKILTAIKKTFTKGIKKFPRIALMYLISLVPLAIIGAIIYLIYAISPSINEILAGALMLIVILGVLLPYCFIKRVYYIESIKEI